MRATRLSRRGRLSVLMLCILFTIFVTYWYLSGVNTHEAYLERHSYDLDLESASVHDLLPIMSTKDTLSVLKWEEKQKQLRHERLTGSKVNASHRLKWKKTDQEKEDEIAVKNFKNQLVLRHQLENGVPDDGPFLVKFDNLTISAFDLSKNFSSWQKELGTPFDIVASTEGVFPKKFLPEVGNGHLASVVFSNRLHVNNFYIGSGKESRR